MSFIKFNLPTKEQLETAAKYWPHLLIAGMFSVLISSNVYVYLDNQQTRKEVKDLNNEFRLYLYRDHSEMLNEVKNVSNVLDKAFTVGKENNEFLRELLKKPSR